MARLLFTDKFKEKIMVSEGGFGIYLRGFALIEDKKHYFQNLNDEEKNALSITNIKKNTLLYTDPSKNGDILDTCWQLTYMPTLEYDGKESIGVYEFPYNASIQYEIGKSIKNKTIEAIALIGQCFSEDKTYVKPLQKSYLAGFILFDENEKIIGDNSYTFKLDIGLSKNADINVSLTEKLDFDTFTKIDSDTTKLSGSYIIPAVKNNTYANIPSETVNLNYFINSIAPNEVNNTISTKCPVTIWCNNKHDIPMQLSIGGLVDGSFYAAEINFKIVDGNLKINSSKSKNDERYELFPKQLQVTNKSNYDVKDDTLSGFAAKGFGLNNSNIKHELSNDDIIFNLSTNEISLSGNDTSINNLSLIDSENISLLKSYNNSNIINSNNINQRIEESSILDSNFIATNNFETSGSISTNSFIGTDGVIVHANTNSATDTILVGKNANSIITNNEHNILIGNAGLYANKKDKYIFGSHNSNFTCPVCNGSGVIQNPDDESKTMTCTACNGYGGRNPLFAIGNGKYSFNDIDDAYFDEFVNKDAKDFNGEYSKYGYRLNLFAVENYGLVENIHYRLCDKVEGKNPNDMYNAISDFASVAVQNNSTVGNGYTLKPCYYTKGFIAFPKINHNEVYRIDYNQLFDLANGVYDRKGSTMNNELRKHYKGLKAQAKQLFKGRHTFNLALKEGMQAGNQFTTSDISDLILKQYGKNINVPSNFINPNTPVLIYCHNYSKSSPLYIKGSMWYKGVETKDGLSTRVFTTKKTLNAGDTLRLIYRKGAGNVLEGALNFNYINN